MKFPRFSFKKQKCVEHQRLINHILSCTHLSRGEAYELHKRFHAAFPSSFVSSKTAFVNKMSSNASSEPILSRLFDIYATAPVHVPSTSRSPSALTRLSPMFGKKAKHIPEKTLGFVPFAQMVSAFSPNANMDEKLELLFKVFDIDEAGYLTPQSLESFVWAVVKRSNLDITQYQVRMISQDTIRKALLDSDSPMAPGVNLTQFKAMFMHCKTILEMVTIPLWDLVQTKDMDTNQLEDIPEPESPPEIQIELENIPEPPASFTPRKEVVSPKIARQLDPASESAVPHSPKRICVVPVSDLVNSKDVSVMISSSWRTTSEASADDPTTSRLAGLSISTLPPVHRLSVPSSRSKQKRSGSLESAGDETMKAKSLTRSGSIERGIEGGLTMMGYL